MGPLDILWHLVNFFLPAIGVGVLAAGIAKLLWRQALAPVRWWHLAASASAAGALCLLAGMAIGARDGLMVTYAALVVASALALWWVGFGPGRR